MSDGETLSVLDEVADDGAVDEVEDAWKTMPFDEPTVLDWGILALSVCRLGIVVGIGM